MTHQKNASITTGWNKQWDKLTSEAEDIQGWAGYPHHTARSMTARNTRVDLRFSVIISPGMIAFTGVFMQILSSEAPERC